jgi:outer membrane protein OmpA-like peptidoglycan-associated protein
MKSRLSRIAIALALAALVPACAAESTVVLLKNPLDADDHVHISNSKGTFGINTPGYGTALNKHIHTVHRYEPGQISAEFSGALEGMAKILADGLPPLPHSYVALLEIPRGPLGKLAFNSERGEVLLDKAGQGVLIDGYSDDPYPVDMRQIRKDFGPALEALDEIIKAGFRPSTYVVLLESPDGSVGKVTVDDARGRALIEQAGQAADMGIYLTDERLFKVEEKVVKEEFGNALDSRPPLPARYVLLFKSGSTRLAAESEEESRKLLEDVKSRPAPDITIVGHTDTVGGAVLNDKLSQKRAEHVSELIRTQGAELRALEIQYHGKRMPFVVTPDNTPELRNRRVEVVVR